MSMFPDSKPFVGMIRWRRRPWAKVRMFVGLGETADEAVAQCCEEAEKAGWKAPS